MTMQPGLPMPRTPAAPPCPLPVLAPALLLAVGLRRPGGLQHPPLR